MPHTFREGKERFCLLYLICVKMWVVLVTELQDERRRRGEGEREEKIANGITHIILWSLSKDRDERREGGERRQREVSSHFLSLCLNGKEIFSLCLYQCVTVSISLDLRAHAHTHVRMCI